MENSVNILFTGSLTSRSGGWSRTFTRQIGVFSMTKFLLSASVAAVALVASTSANAATILWTLNSVVYDDGGTASGTFATDSTTGLATAVNISVTAGPNLSAFTFDGATSQILNNIFFNNQSFVAVNNAFTRYVSFAFVNPLTAPGSNPLNIGIFPNRASWDCANCGNIRYAVSGFATSGAVPEPAAWALMIAGFGLVGGAMRRRQQSVRVTYA